MTGKILGFSNRWFVQKPRFWHRLFPIPLTMLTVFEGWSLLILCTKNY